VLLPLFPLPSVVLFPGARLPLHIFEPRYRRMVADLLARPEDERRVGMIYAAAADREGTELVEPGCAGRLVAHEPLDDGRSNIVLHGEFRFEVEREVDGRPYRRAVVRPLPDRVPPEEATTGETLREELLRLAIAVHGASRGSAPYRLEDLMTAGDTSPALAALTNRLAAALDLPPERKQSLLAEPVLSRGEEVAGILRSRLFLFETLAPYRHLAERPEAN